jgi:hypothetical protein
MVDEENLSYRLQEILNDIPIRELRTVFTARIKRLIGVGKGMEAINPSSEILHLSIVAQCIRFGRRKDLSTIQ